MTSAQNQATTSTTQAAIPTRYRTTICGIARITRTSTVSLRCAAGPAKPASTGAPPPGPW